MKPARVFALAVLLSLVGERRTDANSSGALRVCADPLSLPFSNQKGEGFENRIAELMAKELHMSLEYTWWVHRRGFLRSTLRAGACDVVMGLPVGLEQVRTTKAYYRSTFAFVTRRGELGDLHSFDDPRLPSLTIGIPLVGDDGANPVPAHALARRGMTDNVRGFSVFAELGRSIPAAAEALGKGEIDVAVLWGPTAGSAMKRSPIPLHVTSVSEEMDGGLPVAVSIAMAVRPNDDALAARLDEALERKRDSIAAILRDADVPLVGLPTGGRHVAP